MDSIYSKWDNMRRVGKVEADPASSRGILSGDMYPHWRFPTDPPLSEKNIIRFNVVMNVFIRLSKPKPSLFRLRTCDVDDDHSMDLCSCLLPSSYFSSFCFIYRCNRGNLQSSFFISMLLNYFNRIYKSTVQWETNLTTRWQDSNPAEV